MKSSKSPSIQATGSRWVAPLLIAGGVVIGVALTWAVLISMESFQKDLINQPVQVLPVVVDQAVTSSTESLLNQEKGILEIEATWIQPKVLSDREIKNLLLNSTTNTELIARTLVKERSTDTDRQCDSLVKKIWSVGQVTNGALVGSDIYYVEIEGSCEMWDSYTFYNFLIRKVENEKEDLYLVASDPESYPESYFKQSQDPFFGMLHGVIGGVFKDLQMPTSLHLESGKWLQLVKTVGYEIIPLNLKSQMKIVGTTIGGDAVYRRSDYSTNHTTPMSVMVSGIGVFDSIGRFYEYGSFMNAKETIGNDSNAYFDSSISVKKIARMPDSEFERVDGEEEYSPLMHTGCGPGPIDVVSVDPSALIEAGTYLDDSVYIPKDFLNDQTTKEVYDQWLALQYESKPSIEEFLKSNPVPYFLWKDAIGQWIRYTSSKILPQAECGKPVIYLYPATTTQVSVKLPSFINVTVSDPQYPVNGWSVTANPNGDLVSRDDGKTYGSLYWEGTGVGYQVPKTGFIVKDGNVSSFLTTTLPKYGLNPKEMKEFMDFWVPRMVGAPYYQISFLTNEWSRVAPLNVTPRPQTSIRIFMDWKPLSRSKPIKAPTIVTPARNGFTLVEWGGLLYK